MPQLNALDELLTSYRGRQILPDANLFLLLLVGTFQRSLISRFKRTAEFTEAQFDLLLLLLSQFATIVTTPHLLTEVNSLGNALPFKLIEPWHEHVRMQTATLLEILVPANALMQQTSFLRYGLADAALENVPNDTLVLTEDYRLSGFLRSQGIDVLNFSALSFPL